MKGVDLVISVNTGTAQTPVWTVAGGQRGATLTEESETIETTNKTTAGAKEFDYGFYSWSISFDGIYVQSELAYEALRTAISTKKPVKIRIVEDADGAGATAAKFREGTAIVTSMELDAPYDDAVTYSGELQGTGPMTAPTT